MIIFLHGPDSFRARRFLKEMKEKFIKEVDTSENSLDILDGQNIDLKLITEKINTGSLFAQKRMIIIENIFNNKKNSIFKELIGYLPKLEEGSDIIAIFKDGEITEKNLNTEAKKLFNFLKKQKFSQEFKNLTPAGLNNFIKKEAESYNKKISQEVASKLIQQTNGDLWLITQNIKKAALSSDKELIDLETISFYLTDKFTENIFALTDAISNKDKTLAVKILEEQYAAGISEEYLIVMLARQFKILLRIKEASTTQTTPDKIAATLKLHPFVIKKGFSQIKNFSITQLKDYFNKIIELDKKNKSGQSSIKTELLLLIADI